MPHIMKTIFKFLALAVVAISICSCETESQSTPRMLVGQYSYVTHLDGSRDTILFGDTLHVGDTARMEVKIYGVSHPLVSAEVKSDPSALACSFECDSSAIKEFFEPDSRVDEGYLHFQPYVMSLRTVLRYIAKKEGDYTVTFITNSEAKEPYSHAEGERKQVIR